MIVSLTNKANFNTALLIIPFMVLKKWIAHLNTVLLTPPVIWFSSSPVLVLCPYWLSPVPIIITWPPPSYPELWSFGQTGYKIIDILIEDSCQDRILNLCLYLGHVLLLYLIFTAPVSLLPWFLFIKEFVATISPWYPPIINQRLRASFRKNVQYLFYVT